MAISYLFFSLLTQTIMFEISSSMYIFEKGVVLTTENESAITNKLLSNGIIFANQTIAGGLVGIGLICFSIKALNLNFADFFGISKQKLVGSLKLASIVSVAFFFVEYATYSAVGQVIDLSADEKLMNDLYQTAIKWNFCLAVIVIGPIYEELFFRGLLFSALLNTFLRIKGTIAVTAIIWAALHIQYEFFSIFMIAICGVTLGVIRYKTNSVVVPIFCHMLLNLMAVMQIHFNS